MTYQDPYLRSVALRAFGMPTSGGYARGPIWGDCHKCGERSKDRKFVVDSRKGSGEVCGKCRKQGR